MSGRTLLSYAAWGGHEVIVTQLLAHQAATGRASRNVSISFVSISLWAFPGCFKLQMSFLRCDRTHSIQLIASFRWVFLSLIQNSFVSRLAGSTRKSRKDWWNGLVGESALGGTSSTAWRRLSVRVKGATGIPRRRERDKTERGSARRRIGPTIP